MEKWHIGKDGEPHKCNAKNGRCPLGGQHYSSEEEAYAASESNTGRGREELSLSKQNTNTSSASNEQDQAFAASMAKANEIYAFYKSDGGEDSIYPQEQRHFSSYKQMMNYSGPAPADEDRRNKFFNMVDSCLKDDDPIPKLAVIDCMGYRDEWRSSIVAGNLAETLNPEEFESIRRKYGFRNPNSSITGSSDYRQKIILKGISMNATEDPAKAAETYEKWKSYFNYKSKPIYGYDIKREMAETLSSMMSAGVPLKEEDYLEAFESTSHPTVFAEAKNIPEPMRQKMLTGDNRYVKFALAGNENEPRSTLVTLLHDKDPQVRLYAARNKQCTDAERAEVYRSLSDDDFLKNTSTNELFAREAMERYDRIKSPETDVKILRSTAYAKANDYLTPEFSTKLTEKALKDKSLTAKDLRYISEYSKNVSVLNVLASSRRGDIRIHAASSQYAPDELIRDLAAHDRSKRVREAATTELNRREWRKLTA